MSTYKTLTVDQLDNTLATNDCLLLDCRKVPDYRQGHLDNAMHAHDALIESLLKKAEKDKHIVIYCYSGHSSQHIAELFSGFGFKNVYSLEGGYDAWNASSYRG